MYGATLFIGVNNSTTVQPVVAIERTIFYRERAAGMYAAVPYAIAQVLTHSHFCFLWYTAPMFAQKKDVWRTMWDTDERGLLLHSKIWGWWNKKSSVKIAVSGCCRFSSRYRTAWCKPYCMHWSHIPWSIWSGMWPNSSGMCSSCSSLFSTSHTMGWWRLRSPQTIKLQQLSPPDSTPSLISSRDFSSSNL